MLLYPTGKFQRKIRRCQKVEESKVLAGFPEGILIVHYPAHLALSFLRGASEVKGIGNEHIADSFLHRVER